MITAVPITKLCRWIVIVTILWTGTASARDPIAVEQWGNEYLRPDQGLASVEIRAEDFTDDGKLANEDEPIQIFIKHLPTGTQYVINQPVTVEGQKSRSIYWKMPAGRYEIVKIARTENSTVRFTKKPRLKHFILKGFALSDLGVWVVQPAGKRALKLKFFSRVVQAFSFPNGDDTLGAIIDGFSGKQLKKLAGGGNVKKSRVNFGSENEMRATITETREVKMVYKMDLKRNSRFNKAMFPVIQRRDDRFRQCYLDGLQLNDSLQGTARFTFTLAKGRGSVQSLKYKGGTLKDQRTVECLYAEIGQMEFPVRVPLTGNMVFNFKAD